MQRVILALVVFLFLTEGFAKAQANINENLETAFLWVNVNTGSDSNPGTQQLPLQDHWQGPRSSPKKTIRTTSARR